MKCLACPKSIIPKRPWGRYCSPRCRLRAWQAKRRKLVKRLLLEHGRLKNKAANIAKEADWILHGDMPKPKGE